MGELETAEELMSLFKALEATKEPNLQQAIRSRIDALIEHSHRSFQSQKVGTRHEGAAPIVPRTPTS